MSTATEASVNERGDIRCCYLCGNYDRPMRPMIPSGEMICVDGEACYFNRIENGELPRRRVPIRVRRHFEVQYAERRGCWCGGQDGEHVADAHAEEGRW